MKTPTRKRAVAVVAIAVLAAGGGLVACKLSPGCPLAIISDDRPAKSFADELVTGRQVRPPVKPNTNTSQTGENAMSQASSRTQVIGQVEHADARSFDRKVLKSQVPVLVDFYADWCGPCKMLAPALEQLARETSDARIVKVNVDHSPELAMRYGVSSIPSLAVFKDGQVVAEHVGLASKGQLKELLRR